MTTEPWQVDTSAAESYESRLVPALMAAWPPRLMEAARLQSGDRVLDVACGTGIVSRTVADRLGADSHIAGLDRNPGMLAVARRLRPDIAWHLGDAAELPFPDASFDRVFCQFALMFYPDRVAALQEMRRVLTPGGTVAVATWADIEISPPYASLAEIVTRLAGPEATAVVLAPFVLPEPAELERLLASAGFESVNVATIPDTIIYQGIDAMLEGEIDATPLGAFLLSQGSSVADQVKTEFREALKPFQTDDGVTFPTAANIATGRRPREN